MSIRFVDRADAGRALGAALATTDGAVGGGADLVLALPRGGVPVAAEVARALGVAWDVFVVRKLGVPGHPELAFGAVASGGVQVLNDDVVARVGLSPAEIDAVAGRQRAEVRAREHRYRGTAPPPQIAGRSVIVVDDGIATGASTRAAVQGVRALEPARVVLAAPVAPARTVAELEGVVDDVVVLHAPEVFHAVGTFYRDFAEVSDGQVAALLAAR